MLASQTSKIEIVMRASEKSKSGSDRTCVSDAQLWIHFQATLVAFNFTKMQES